MIWKYRIQFCLVFVLSVTQLLGQNIYSIKENTKTVPGQYLWFSEIDSINKSITTVHNSKFKQNKNNILNLGITNKSYWVRLTLSNKNIDSIVRLVIPMSYIDSIILYYPNLSNSYDSAFGGDLVSNNQKMIRDPYPSFDINLKTRPTTLYFKVKSSEQLIFSLNIQNHMSTLDMRNLFYGLYTGILLALFLYNLFLFFFIKETVYFTYLLYLFSIFFAQATLIGLSYYIFGRYPYINHLSLYVFSSFVGLSALRFMETFLDIEFNLPRALKYVYIGYALYSISLLLSLFGSFSLSYILLQINGLYASIIAVSIGVILVMKKHRSAKLYLIAWSIFIIGLIFFILKDYNVLPYNNFTRLTMTYGVIIETILLSLALADRINTLKKDNEYAQERIIEEMTRNENLIKNQNIILEDKVAKRTDELEQTLKNLKKAQVKLIESEKMASLGLLTSGIAHEINNPINYVSANVIPLRENILNLTTLINEYKSLTVENFESKSKDIIALEKEMELDYTISETDELINGIEEGAKRTYTIVDGLRTFSRTDSKNKQESDINKGVESTISVLKSQIKPFTLHLDLEPDLPLVFCQMGKLNQVFLNLINNALHALEEKFGHNFKEGILGVKTYHNKKSLFITISDNGMGIPKEAHSKIFEPFYTSKPVGKGTGLGLSISYSIINDHNGNLSFTTKENEGTVFKIELPLRS